MPKYVLALDQGTTSSRAILFDRAGAACALAQKEFRQHFPQPGWVEHDANEIWQTQLEVARQALASAGTTAAEVAAIGITNQRETTVVWDRRTGAPIHRAIVWQDRRTTHLCDALKSSGHDQSIRDKTGLVLDAYFSATKLNWLLDNVEGAREKVLAGDLVFGTIDCWLIWNLTGGASHVTDISNASRTMLFNIHTCEWDEELLSLLDIPRSVLPEVQGNSGIFGETDPALLNGAIPVAGVAGDQQAALFGQMCTDPGTLKNTYGTGCFMMLNTGSEPKPSANNLLTTIAWKIGDQVSYALEGSVFIGGAVVQWLRDGLGLIKSSSDVETLANSVEDNGGVYLVPAFAGLGAPHWDPLARGTMVGLTRGSTAGHVARAALESIAFQSADVMQAMRADAGIEIAELRVDGGATANDTLMQFQADVLGLPIIRPHVTETTALGAAYLAGLAVGFWPDVATLRRQWQTERVFKPKMQADRVQALKHNWQRALDRSRSWLE